ncbi:3-phosphoshikimate 1-carboxyvinyltransferase [Candidatus Neoehrlichia procyonis]|uniref:3-phosphoshikimate 1-carboxyvinyltransferase n=1 Tax=Candidatus Neoehrlichia procyonis str. RAC413 TaxID=1359163 RepID=A0A0F3NPI7_9RICK|nr:3-phosphoshikimate 1-carboxyvinyltransferase [Candidatus Neoehrlichia lotoris]KJV69592.1 EPSP synthase family protein [Candidatus Neoehrlichia lotoris str. RAC413]
MNSKKKAISYKVSSINGITNISGDKFISCIALILASQAIGITRIYGISLCQDVMCVSKALSLLGVEILYEKGDCIVKGVGIGGLMCPKNALYMGNSFTITCMLLGLLSTYPFLSFFYGSRKLCSVSMDRVTEPLLSMGSNYISVNGKLPILLIGSEDSIPISYSTNSVSDKVKVAVLLAGLNTSGISIITERILTRNHIELLLQYLNADISVNFIDDSNIITLRGQKELFAKDIYVPSDAFLAAFIVAAALMVENSEVIIHNVMINSDRMGFYRILINMGANITLTNKRKSIIGECIADIFIKTSVLHGGIILEKDLPSIVEEYPIISIIAAYIDGTTVMQGMSLLDTEERNRLNIIICELNKCGVNTEMTDSELIIYGSGGNICGGNVVNVHSDDKIAMSFLILGMVSKQPIIINDVECISSSYTDFISIVNQLGGKIKKLI